MSLCEKRSTPKEPIEIERKLLIEYPDVAWLSSIPDCTVTEITQTYLNSEKDEEIRVRKRGANGEYTFYHTVKRKISSLKRFENERTITEYEYLKLLEDADPSRHPIHKTRYCLRYQDQTLEIDVYPFWNDKAILEIELNDENTPIAVPEQIKILRDVTEDENYKNAALAKIAKP